MEQTEKNISVQYPIVSTIALCYNQSGYAIETLNSILSQTYPGIQLIILDDCSSDNSVETINNWISKNEVDCIFIKHEINQGICKSLNDALTHATGDYIQIIACDDIMLPQKTEMLVNLLINSSEDTGVAYSDAYLIDDNGDPLYNMFISYNKPFLKIPEGQIFEDLVHGNFIPVMSALIKTKAIRDVGNFDETLLYEDYDLWLRISRKYKFVYNDTPVVKYRLHARNFSKSVSENYIYNFYVLMKHIDHPAALQYIEDLLCQMYNANNKRYKDLSWHYFSKIKNNSLIFKCMRYRLHPYLYKVIRILPFSGNK